MIGKDFKWIVSGKGTSNEAEELWLRAHPGLPDSSAEQWEAARHRILKVQPWTRRGRKQPLGDENLAEEL